MSTQKLSVKCSTCRGTGVETYNDSQGNPLSRPCTACGADGWLDTGLIDTTTIEGNIDSLQKSLDQISEIVKEQSDYIKKIYEIVSKEK